MPEQLGVRILGEFRLDGVDLRSLRSRKARTLLKVLALAGGTVVTADSLVDAVWGDDLPADPSSDLSVLVSRSRAIVGAERLVRRDGGYALMGDWNDREELVALTREATRRQESGDVAGARTAAEGALALVRGPLLMDETDAEWVTAARAATAAVVAEARLVAASAALAAGHVGDAAAHARSALEHDPFDEAALRVLMTAHVVSGRPASALAAYAEVRALLAGELGVSPSPETEALHRAVLMGELPSRDEPLVGSMGATRLVGRDPELAALDAAMQRSLRGGEVVVVSGEAGVGKTSLLEAWAERARARAVLVLAGRAEDGIGLALQPVIDAIATHASVNDREDATDSGWSNLPGPLATGDALRLDQFDSMGALLRRISPPAGLALIIDDVHLADAMTLAWMAHVLRRRGDHRLLIVGGQRDEVDVVVPSSTVIALGPLDESAIAELVGEERAPALLARTGGNPLLLVELAAADDLDDVPATVLEAVAGRLRRAGDAGATLRTAAVLGPVIDLDLLSSVMAKSPLDVLEHLDEGARRAFLTERDGMMVFRHELVRNAVAADTTATRRAWAHREAARLLAERHDVNPLELAYHARQGGDRVLAADGLARAADIARSRVDLAGAEQLLDEAIDLHDSAAARLRRSRIRMARANIVGADLDAEVAVSLGGGAEALELRAWAARNRHDADAAIRLGRAGAEMATEAATKASCLLAVAFAYKGIGDLPTTDRLLDEARALGPPAALGLNAWFGVLRIHQGRADEGLADLEPLLGSDAGTLQSFWVEHVLQMTAHGYGLVGRATEGLAVVDRMEIEQQRRGSDARYGGLALNYRGWFLRNLGVEAADDLACEAIEIGKGPEIRSQAYLDHAESLLLRRQFDQAAAALASARVEFAPGNVHNRWRCEQRAGVISARLHLATASPKDALDDATRVAEVASQRGEHRYTTIARLVAAQASARLGDRVDVDAVADDLAHLRRVAAMEAWRLAADVADDTAMTVARTVASDAAEQLIEHAGPYADVLRAAVAARFS